MGFFQKLWGSPKRPALKVGQCSLRGNVRDNNEDSIEVLALPQMTLCLVADGMGGQAAGEVASKHAVEVVARELKSSITSKSSNEEIKSLISAAGLKANLEVLAMSAENRTRRNMGSTLLLALGLKGSSQIFVANLGDSRAYQIRDSKIIQLTVDHTITQALLDAKTITPEQAKTHPYRNSLCKYVGCPDLQEGPDAKIVPVQTGDRYLLCSDGISGVISDEELLAFIKAEKDPQKCADGLAQLALANGSRDNVSCIVIDVTDGK